MLMVERRAPLKTFTRITILDTKKNVNPVLSYNIYLRSAILDSHLSNDNDLKNYQRAIEPALDINMRNPSYNFILGYRRLEQWYTARLTDDSRRTTNYYYSRLDLNTLRIYQTSHFNSTPKMNMTIYQDIRLTTPQQDI
jgi:hypothetical protein